MDMEGSRGLDLSFVTHIFLAIETNGSSLQKSDEVLD
jgi:hypothetical protein